MSNLQEISELHAEFHKRYGEIEVGGPFPYVTIIYMVDPGVPAYHDYPEPPRYEPLCMIYDAEGKIDQPPPEDALRDARLLVGAVNALPQLIKQQQTDKMRIESLTANLVRLQGVLHEAKNMLPRIKGKAEDIDCLAYLQSEIAFVLKTPDVSGHWEVAESSQDSLQIQWSLPIGGQLKAVRYYPKTVDGGVEAIREAEMFNDQGRRPEDFE